MSEFKWFSLLLLMSGMAGCCSMPQFSECAPPPARLVDVNTERGDAWGRNSYEYRTHELHPDHMRRYDYHPRTYHRFVHDEETG